MAKSSPKHQVGCAELPASMSRAKYFEKLALLEIAAFSNRKPGTSKPGRKVVRGWREKSPDTARYSVLAHSELTGAKAFPTDGEGVEIAVGLADSCEVLGAEAVVFRTSASFSPSAQNRDRMKAFFTEIATVEKFGNTVRVWEPSGLWEHKGIADMAELCGLLVAVDPLAQDPLDEKAAFVVQQMALGQAYLRISGMGHSRRRYDGYQLEMVAEMVGDLERSWTLFAHQGMYPDALAMQRELQTVSDLE
ncbi:MAG: DUF72 domain-containing protein [Myxococcales bacterium]|nr:DUF72 domain-containing protein [Myxococcales bacterium]